MPDITGRNQSKYAREKFKQTDVLTQEQYYEFDIVNDYRWSNSYSKDAMKNVPWIELVEYQQTTSTLFASLAYWYNQLNQFVGKWDEIKDITKGSIEQIKQNPKEAIKKGIKEVDTAALNPIFNSDPYKGMYRAYDTGYVYRFPYYADYDHQINNRWGEAKSVTSFMETGLVALSKIINPAAGIESPRAWEGSQVARYTITFQLLNTMNITDADKNIEKNMDFKNTFINANLHHKINVAAALPPVIYTVNIPGIRYSPAAVVSDITVSNIGQLNYIPKLKKNIPDAWEFRITITELIGESRAIFSASEAGSKIEAIVVPEKEVSEVIEEKFDEDDIAMPDINIIKK